MTVNGFWRNNPFIVRVFDRTKIGLTKVFVDLSKIVHSVGVRQLKPKRGSWRKCEKDNGYMKRAGMHLVNSRMYTWMTIEVAFYLFLKTLVLKMTIESPCTLKVSIFLCRNTQVYICHLCFLCSRV